MEATYGAVILGALCASALSGIVTAQCLVYLKLFPSDRKLWKCVVIFVWTLDVMHMTLVWEGIWEYFVVHFGKHSYIDFVPGTIALSVVLTAALTFLAQCLFAHRIYYLSKKNMCLTVPLIVLAFLRLSAATVSGIEMIHLRSFTLFRQKFLWLSTLGLSLSCAVDIMITCSLFFLLKKNREETLVLHHIIDSLVLYVFEMNLATSAATIVSMLCWILLENNLVFLGLHFIIGQLYANSLLATLNSRDGLRRAHSSSFDFLNLTLQHNGTDLQFYHTRHRNLDQNPVQFSNVSPGPISFKENEFVPLPLAI